MWTSQAAFLPRISGLLLAIFGFSLCRGAVLFEDNFDSSPAGWTAIQPPGAYIDGPLRWQYFLAPGAFVEQSNIYTDNPTASPTAIAPMLINDTLTAVNFTFSARLTAGDDDGFGLIFGYQNETNFYRVTFARQARTAGFPWNGWAVDRKVNGTTVNLFGAGTAGYVKTFVNTTNRPFDVTIMVDTANRLTLTVLDNPTGTSTNYPLVTAQTLPSAANGQVGLMTWGMSGLTPPGFRIQNLALTPIGLTGNLNALTWASVVPPMANGSSALGGGTAAPAWSLDISTNGPHGVLYETSDALAGNTGTNTVDFTGPTLVAGDTNWTNYVMAARITPGDDDGQGILLRYLNLTNFYRISLRSQVSTSGIPPGLAIQKCVNRAYTEIYHDNPVQYDPVAGVPYELVASIQGNSLDLLLVSDPDGAAQPYTYGPFTVTGVPKGKIGLFSWAMSQCEFDNVSVQDGTPLYVSSPLGAPLPGKGMNGFPANSVVTAYAPSVIDNQQGFRHSASGWTGFGSAPPSGSGSNVTFTITNFSHIHWLWSTEYRLSVTNGPGGSVTAPAGEWFPAGTSITLSAQADPGYAFAGWSGALLSTAPTFNFSMDQPYDLVANFTADADADGLPDAWELASFGNLDAAPGEDPDGDGRTNLEEFQNNTHPLVSDTFKIASLDLGPTSALLTISNTTGTRYAVERATTLTGPWSIIASTQFTSFYTSALPASDTAFWRIQQPARPPEALPFVPGSWSLVILPDTQIYSMSYPELFKDQARWIIANKDRHNIKYVIHLGDISNNNTPAQWANASNALTMLNGVVPYALVNGNHDYGTNGSTSDRSTLLDAYFPLTNYLSWPTFGGAMVSNRLDNSYHLFSAGGADWLILCLEFGPRNSVVAWANSIVNAYPNRRVILVTHALYVLRRDALRLGRQRLLPTVEPACLFGGGERSRRRQRRRGAVAEARQNPSPLHLHHERPRPQ